MGEYIMIRTGKKEIVLCLVGMFLFSITNASSQETGVSSGGSGSSEDPYIVPRASSNIRIDGDLDEEAWRDALVLELRYEVSPGENIDPPVRTEVLLTCNDENLYAAFRCQDPDPSAIRAHLTDREDFFGDDHVNIHIDTFNDERRSFTIGANPFGVQMDAISTLNFSFDWSWDTIFESDGRIYSWGYVVELAVPFDQIRFQRTGGSQVWGFDAWRIYPRSVEHYIGVIPQDRNNNCFQCQMVKIEGFEGVSPGHNLELVPTLMSVRTDVRNEMPAGTFQKENQEAQLGLTSKWGITPNLTLGGTLNPDFSQVEADALLVDINEPFALYYSEKRPFFTEGADFFSTLKRAVYTRTMRDPSYGLKLTGKEFGNTLGGYVVRDDLTNLIFPGSQSSRSSSLNSESTASVFRYKRDISNRYTLGALFTDREGQDYFNRMYGFDGNLLLTRTDQLQVQYLQSSTRYPMTTAEEYDQRTGPFGDNFIALEYDHETRNIGWWLDYERAGSDFRADLGFIPRVGYSNVEGGVNYEWTAKPGAWWSSMKIGNELNYYEDMNGNPFDRKTSLWFEYYGNMQSSLYTKVTRSRERFLDREFGLTSYWLQGGFWPAGNIELYFWGGFGDRVDYANVRPGRRILLNPYVEYRPGKHLRLSLDQAYERMNVDGGTLYTANISQLTVIYQLSVRTFLRSIIQYVDYRYNTGLYTFDIDHLYSHVFTQHLFSYKINPQTVLFLGYTDNAFGNSSYDLTRSDRTFFAKVGYAGLL
jgi:hypothetical protein